MKHTQRHFEGRIKSREKKTTTCILRWLLNFMFGSFRFLCVYKCTYSMNHFYSHSDFFVRVRFLSVCGDIKMNQFWWKKFGSSMKTSGCKPNDHKIHSCVVCARQKRMIAIKLIQRNKGNENDLRRYSFCVFFSSRSNMRQQQQSQP